LLFCSAAFADRHLSSDPRVNEARALIQEGRNAAALDVLRPLARQEDRSDRTDVLFLIGLSATRLSQQPGIGEQESTALLDEAIMAFRTILIDRPELVRVGLDLALAFFLKDDDGLSRRHFEQVLAGRPPPAMAFNIRRFLSAIRARRRWSGHFGVSIAPDSNINTASGVNTIRIGGLPFEFGGDENRSQSGVGLTVWGGGEYRHPLGENMRLRLGGNLQRREYRRREFDDTQMSVHAGPMFLPDANTEISLLASGRRQWSGGESYNRALGWRLESSRRMGPRLTFSAETSRHERRYYGRTGLDGPIVSTTLRARWRVSPVVHLSGALGYGLERPEIPRWRNKSRWMDAEVQFVLPKGWQLGLSGTFRRTRYDNWIYFDPTQTGPRRDSIRILSVSTLNRGFTLRGFSPELSLIHETRDSNAQLQSYTRNRMELRLVRQF